jgi:GNAT superfamily N-acetyltransferase
MGRSDSYWKIPFEWTSREPPDDAVPAGWSWEDGEAICRPPTALVAAVLAASPGPEDERAVAALGALGAAERILALAPGFTYLAGRWQVLTIAGEQAGFVLPVVYDGCARGGLDEATISHMGTAPAFRGAGVGRLLLRRATRLLVEHGVWRIFCDTAETNAPMIHLFEDEGWRRLPRHERPLPR